MGQRERGRAPAAGGWGLALHPRCCMPASSPHLTRRCHAMPYTGDVRTQEAMLKTVGSMADTLDYEGLKKAVLPAVHALCLSTTSGALRCGRGPAPRWRPGRRSDSGAGRRPSALLAASVPTHAPPRHLAAAAVRVSAFAAMSRLVPRLDQAEAETMLQTAVKVGSGCGVSACVAASGRGSWPRHCALHARLPMPLSLPSHTGDCCGQERSHRHVCAGPGQLSSSAVGPPPRRRARAAGAGAAAGHAHAQLAAVRGSNEDGAGCVGSH